MNLPLPAGVAAQDAEPPACPQSATAAAMELTYVQAFKNCKEILWCIMNIRVCKKSHADLAMQYIRSVILCRPVRLAKSLV